MKYAFNNLKENMAKAYGANLPISTKKSVEIANHIRGWNVQKSKKYLQKVIKKEEAVPMKRYKRDTAHKKEIAAGKYPVNAAKDILMVLKSAESNALNKGMNTRDLVIAHISAHMASRPWHYGRKRRSKMKRSHIQIVVEEVKKPKPKKSQEKKTEEKKENKQKENKK
jgi:large subunit ribosomal protein L22